MMKATSIFGLLVVCVMVATCVATSPTDVFSGHDAAVTGRLALAGQAKDGTFANVESAHWTLSTLHLLKMKTELEQHKAAVCSFVKQNLDRAADVPTVYHSVSVRELLDCKDKVGTGVVDLLEQGVESDSLEEIYQSVVALATLKRTGAVEFVEDLSGVAKAVHDLMEVDGTFRSGSKSEEGSALSTGHAYHTLALLKKHFSLSPEGQEHVATVVQTVDDFLSTAREEDGMLEFTDLNPLANLKATSLVWTGANALAAVADGAVEVTQDQVTGLAEYFVRNKYVTNAEDAHYLLTALKTVAHNTFKLSPLVVTLSKSSLLTSSKGDEGLVKVLVTDIFGQFAERVAVYISKVFPVDQEKQIILRNQQAQPLSDSPQNVAYSFNFLATKPDQGFYSLEISVSPLEKNSPYLPVEETTRIVKVVAVVDLTEATLQITDSKEHDDDSFASNPLSLQFPNKLADTLRANSLQTVVLSFRAQASGRPVTVNQAFLRFTNLETKHEAVFVAEQHGKKYKFSVNIKDQVDAFQGRSGKYALTLVVGDALIQNPTAWEVATIHIQFGKLQRESVPEVASGPLPEIVHQFRAPDKRPPPVVSFVFTALVLAPFVAFLIGLLYVGANFRNFPFSNPKSLFFATGFQACIGCLFGLFVVYWLRLTMVQTLCYLLVLGLVTIFFGQQALRYVAAVREHKKVD